MEWLLCTCFASDSQEVDKEMLNDCDVLDFFSPPLNDYFIGKYAILVNVLSQGMKNNLIPGIQLNFKGLDKWFGFIWHPNTFLWVITKNTKCGVFPSSKSQHIFNIIIYLSSIWFFYHIAVTVRIFTLNWFCEPRFGHLIAVQLASSFISLLILDL